MFRKIKRIICIALIIFITFKAVNLVANDVTYEKETIVVDAGHGGRDPGTVGFNGSYEKDIALEISQKLEKALNRKGYRVISTRDTDEYVDNLERAKLANESSCSLFISIHGNSTEDNSQVNGVEVLHYPNKENYNTGLSNSDLAQTMMDLIINRTGANSRGIVGRKDLIVLNQTKMPAIIIECGFLSNEKEEKLLLTNRYQKKLVDSIVDGVEEYFK